MNEGDQISAAHNPRKQTVQEDSARRPHFGCSQLIVQLTSAMLCQLFNCSSLLLLHDFIHQVPAKKCNSWMIMHNIRIIPTSADEPLSDEDRTFRVSHSPYSLSCIMSELKLHALCRILSSQKAVPGRPLEVLQSI
jgi:hypothetical protein